MKKFLCIIFVITLIISIFAVPSTAVAEEYSAYDYYTAYVGAHPSRSVQDGSEIAAAELLKQTLIGFGYTAKSVAFVDAGYNSENDYNYVHLFATKDNGKDRDIVLGTHYGSVRSTAVTSSGEGAETGIGVGLMLYLARKLATLSLDYNVTIAFWGGYEFNSVIDLKKCGIDVDKTSLYINFDAVAAGKYDYAYYDDVSRTHGDFFDKVISDLNANIKSAPIYKKPSGIAGYSVEMPYLHAGLDTNAYFMDAGVPSVNFFGGAWDYDCGLYRYEKRSVSVGTGNDTVAKINELNGGEEKTKARLDAVAQVVLTAVTKEGFSSALNEAKSDVSAMSLHNKIAYIVINVVGSVGVLAFLIIYMRKSKVGTRAEAWRGTQEKNFKENEQNAENIFDDEKWGNGEIKTEEKENQENKQDEDDDIFRF